MGRREDTISRYSVRSSDTDLSDRGSKAHHSHLPTVLIVDDEKGVLDFSAMVLQQAGYNVLKAQSPSEAVRIFKEYGGMISAVVTDVVMPEMNGYDMAKYLRRICPDLKLMYMSGYAEDEVTKSIAADKNSILIPKPFTPQILRQAVGVLIGLGKDQVFAPTA